MRYWLWMAALIWTAPATSAEIFKCVQPDGSVAFQQVDCPKDATQGKLEIKVPKPPGNSRRQLLQVVDPTTGESRAAWVNVPETSAPDYSPREMHEVIDAQTGMPRQAWVNMPPPLPPLSQESAVPPTPRAGHQLPETWTMPERAPGPNRNYYNPSDQERRRNSQYEKARCKIVSC